MTPESFRPWIRAVRPDARFRLITFPYAGGGTLDYRGWDERLGIDVNPVVLPGRETRLGERPYDDLRRLVGDLARDLAPLLRGGPFAFAGHSMGAWIAFELARELRRLRRPLPAHLFVSARRAPHVPDTSPPLYALPEAEFIAAIQARYNAIPAALLARPEVLKLFVPALRGDFTLLDTYVYTDAEPLPVPISAFAGTEDAVVHRSDVARWREHTSAVFVLRDIAGGHFFLRDNADALLAAFAESLRPHTN